jgi:serine/threonine protein kinase
MAAMQTQYIIKSSRENSHLIVILSSFEYLIGKEWSSVSKAAKDLIKKMLQKLPTNRVSASEALSDAWIKSF